jgi:drug/metabolite transporter (DMT)-like permease
MLVARDVTYDLLLSATISGVAFAFSTTSSIAAAAAFTVSARRQVVSITSLLKDRHVCRCAIALGLLSAVIYAVTFVMIHLVGAGLFNLVDYGLTPLLTATIGAAFFRERLATRYFISAPIYVVGVCLLFRPHGIAAIHYVAVIALSPIATACSDALAKSLLQMRMSPHQLLLIRFVPAAVILGIFLAVLPRVGLSQAPPPLLDFTWLLPIAFILGYLPLLALLTGLKTQALTSLAVWELCIPALAYITTVGNRGGFGRPTELCGAILILCAAGIAQDIIPTKGATP